MAQSQLSADSRVVLPIAKAAPEPALPWTLAGHQGSDQR